jgi:plasmid stabilization system protein ParE
VKDFELSRRALKDLELICQYISNDSVDAADAVLDDFERCFSQLADFPGMGHRRSDLTNRNLRFWPVHSYLVIYQQSNPLRIVRVIHGKRDVRRILKKP